MKINRRTTIISETERKFSFSVRTPPARFFCPACEEQREMLSINEAAKRSGARWRDIVRQIEDGVVHTTETDGGEIYVCAKSLAEFNEQQLGS